MTFGTDICMNKIVDTMQELDSKYSTKIEPLYLIKLRSGS